MESLAVNFLKENDLAPVDKTERYYNFFANDYSKIRLFKMPTPDVILSTEILKAYHGVYCDFRLNDTPGIDSYLDSLNQKIEEDTHLLIRFEPQVKRKLRLIKSVPLGLGKLYYHTFDFLVHRVLSRLALSQQMYFKLSKSKNQVLSIPEVLGRVIAAGFEVVEIAPSKEDTYVLAVKSQRPAINRKNSNGLLIKLGRIGYRGKRVNVFKFRTMRPYSEYVQKYVLEKNGTIDGDKIANDFRVTGWGRILRKYWIDELPMIINLLKGQIKLVGVRPLSDQKFYSYPKYLQEKRIKVKPGLLPPYYADLPKTPEEFHRSEALYTDAYLKAPLKTDLNYFFKIIRNIVFRGARSK